MGAPKPTSSLDGGCSAIHGNTLYVYTPDAFQSLVLAKGEKWKNLKMDGVKVTGAACANMDTGDEPGLFIVGGTGPSDYSGIQKYTYSTGKWETLDLPQTAAKNRQGHAALYLPADNSIVMYGGTNGEDSAGSPQTWTIAAQTPYAMVNHGTNAHGQNALMMAWSDSDICMVGGDAGTTLVSLFNNNAGWRNIGTQLSAPPAKDSKSMQGVVIAGSDKSMTLYTFDLSESPNKVSRYVLAQAGTGASVPASAPITSKKKDKRGLTQADWPNYNPDGAPTDTRTNFAIAQGSDGKVVFTGGNDKSPYAMFSATDNAWMDPAQVAVVNKQEDKLQTKTKTKSKSKSKSKTKTSSTKTATSTSATATATSSLTSSIATTTSASVASSTISATSSSTATDAPAAHSGGSADHGLSANAILGITLGSILGFLALMGLFLLVLRRRSRYNQKGPESDQAQERDFPSDEKDPALFGNGPRGGPSPNHNFRGHHHQSSQDSFSSMAILMGRHKETGGLARDPSQRSDQTYDHTQHRELKSKISKPILHEMQHPAFMENEPRAVSFDPNTPEPRQRAGPAEAQDGLRRSSGWNRYWSGGSALQILGFGGNNKRTTAVSDQSSRYSMSTAQPQNPRATQDSATVPPLNFDFRPEVNRVNSGSPVVAQPGGRIPYQEGVAAKFERHSSNSSSGYSSGIPESVNESWLVTSQSSKPWGTDRAPNAAYETQFPFNAPLTPSGSGDLRNHPSGVSKQPQLAMASQSSDMSWLNLGDQSRV